MLPQRFRAIITRSAFTALDELLTYIAKSSPQNAGAVIDRLLRNIQSLEYFPHRCRVTPQGGAIDPALRTMTVRPFLIDFKVDDDSKTLRIPAVTHGASRR